MRPKICFVWKSVRKKNSCISGLRLGLQLWCDGVLCDIYKAFKIYVNDPQPEYCESWSKITSLPQMRSYILMRTNICIVCWPQHTQGLLVVHPTSVLDQSLKDIIKALLDYTCTCMLEMTIPLKVVLLLLNEKNLTLKQCGTWWRIF